MALTIEVKNAQKQSLEISVENTEKQEVNVTQGVLIVPVYKDATVYEGEYEVTPKLEAQTLPTKDRVLIDDMTVKGIDVHRVKNSTGGTTVYIAKGV